MVEAIRSLYDDAFVITDVRKDADRLLSWLSHPEDRRSVVLASSIPGVSGLVERIESLRPDARIEILLETSSCAVVPLLGGQLAKPVYDYGLWRLFGSKFNDADILDYIEQGDAEQVKLELRTLGIDVEAPMLPVLQQLYLKFVALWGHKRAEHSSL